METDLKADELRSQIHNLAEELRAQVRTGFLSPFSAVGLVRAACRIGPSWDAAVLAIEELAKGPDGIMGTDDDPIPSSTAIVLTTLLRTGAVRDLMDWFRDDGEDTEPEIQDTYRPEDVGVCCATPVSKQKFGCFGFLKRFIS